MVEFKGKIEIVSGRLIEDPTARVESALYNYSNKTAIVEMVLFSPSYSISVKLNPIPYENAFTDEELNTIINNWLTEHTV